MPASLMGRRTFNLLGMVALAGSCVPAVFRASTRQTTDNVTANHFIPSGEELKLLQNFGASSDAFHSSLGGYAAAHQNLFHRTTTLSWWQDPPPVKCYPKKTRVGDVVTESGEMVCPPPGKPIRHEETLSVWSDQFLPVRQRLTYEELGVLLLASNRFQSVSNGRAARMQSSELLDIRCHMSEAELRALDDDALAAACGFNWAESEEGIAGPIALAAAVAVPLSLVSLFYDRLISDERPARKDRRAFLRTIFAAGGAAVGLSLMGGSDETLDRIRDKGRTKIRGTITEAGHMSGPELFRRYLGRSPQEFSEGMLLDMKVLSRQLSRLSGAEVGLALAAGEFELENKARDRELEIRRGNSRVRDFDTDSNVDIGTILGAAQFVELAHTTSRVLSRERGFLARFFGNDEVIDILTPAMRALYVTEGLAGADQGQRGGHLGRVAGDVGLYVGIPLGLLILSEIPGPHHELASSVVRALGRALGKKDA